MPHNGYKRDWKRLAAGLLLAVCSGLNIYAADQLPAVKPETVGLSSARLDRLAQAIKQDVDHGRMPGAVVAIARKGKLAYYESFGFVDKAANAPMPKDAIFALASMTKPMVAVATLMLAEQGDLLLNDPVGNYLPELKDMKVATPRGIEAAHRQPTLQDMLRHTAGVSYGNRGDTRTRVAPRYRREYLPHPVPLFAFSARTVNPREDPKRRRRRNGRQCRDAQSRRAGHPVSRLLL